MPRTKLLTNYTYSPTNPSSEDAIRSQIDGSIDEVYNLTYEKTEIDNLLNQIINETDLDPNKDPEVTNARGSFNTLGLRLDNADDEIENIKYLKADITYVDTQIESVADGSPKGVYATLLALQTAFPTGTTGIYVVTADGNWYYWNASAWEAGGVYQGTTLEAVNSPITDSGNYYSALNVETALQEIALRVDQLKTDVLVPHNLLNLITVTNGKYVESNGTLSDNAAYKSSDYIQVKAGKTYTFQTGTSANSVDRQVRTINQIAEYDENKVNIGASYKTYVDSFTASVDGFIRFSVEFYMQASQYPAFVEGTEIVNQISYSPITSKPYIKREVIPVVQYMQNGVRNLFDINSDDFIGIDDYQNMCAYSITFRADITTFNGIKLGKGYQEFMGGTIEIDNVNIKVYEGASETPYMTYTHGLTLADYISVTIEIKYGNVASVKLCTNGGEYEIAYTSWDVRKGTLFVKSVGTNVLTGCNLSYYCYGLEKPTYIYGDSYLTNAQGVTDRWPSYLLKDNHTNFMLNGYSGRGSADALNALKLDLKLGIPKRIIWCMGMNDADTAGAINASWLSCVEELKTICENNGIELILSTIPWVNSVGNVKKNEYVVASGYRYIDFAKSVGASSDSTWYANMLSVDNVHPAIEGARALCRQAVSDAPELLS